MCRSSKRLRPTTPTGWQHPSDDAYWRAIAPREAYERITAPALNMGGWFDIFLGGTLANYRGCARGAAATPRASTSA